MKKLMSRHTRRVAAWCSLVLQVHLLGVAAFGQSAPDCSYDRERPSLTSARQSYQLFFNFGCAEQEVLDVLAQSGLSPQEKAGAHALLAIIFFLSSPGDPQRDEKVIEQLESAIRLDTTWTSEQEQVAAPWFDSLVVMARQEVAREGLESSPAAMADSRTVDGFEALGKLEDSGGRNKLPWLIGGGVVVVGAIFLLAGGGGGGGDEPLPGFPAHPKGSR